MFSNADAKAALQNTVWEEGKIVPVAESPYRYRLVVHCTARGRQRTEFANGEGAYFSYLEIVDGNGRWISQGVVIAPVLPDGRLIMVVEQRPAQGRFPDRPTVAHIGGQRLDLGQFGPYSSLEFPGGAVDPNEGLQAAFLRELQEETGVKNQGARYYHRTAPYYPYGSEVAVRNFCGVVFLTGLAYAERVHTDGGLVVLALTPQDIDLNIWSGIIHSGHAALIPWGFYQEVARIRATPGLEDQLVSRGALTVQHHQVAKR